MDKNLATDFWYAKKNKYDFTTGAGNPKTEADMFTRMVWEISNGKIAFARRGKFVMAWYCPSGSAGGINVGDAAAFKKAVKPDTCPKPCTDNISGDRYSKCYQKKGLTAHNAKRDIHKVPNLELDIDIAKRAQKLAETYSTSGTFTAPSGEKCGYNYASASTSTEAMNKDWATNFWYSKGTGFDWANVVFSATAQDFTNMIWRSSTKVGFGVAGTKVVALYCDKGNVRGRFTCNVCKANVGCSTTKCPIPASVCSSKDGEGNAEISLGADRESIRIVATVRKNQFYSIALGSKSLVDSDLIVFHAKATAALSFAKDSRATQALATPTAESH